MVAHDDTPPTTVTRSVRISLESPPELKAVVIANIRRYRALCKELYAILALAQTAGADILATEDDLQVKPNGARAHALLELTLGKTGKLMAYSLRDYALAGWPGVYSYVWDSARIDITTVWKAKDPEFPKARRGWLTLQGARGLAEFRRRGIGIPAAARPKLEKHRLTLRWHHDIGSVEFAVPRLDYGLYRVWKSLSSGCPGWSLGTVYLSERDGDICAVLSHSRPWEPALLDPVRVCRVQWSSAPEAFLCMVGPEGAEMDSLSAVSALGWLQRMHARREELERRRAACGNPKRPWGHRHGWLANQNVLSRVTQQRENGVHDYCHSWSRRIVSRAKSWRCGVIQVQPFPDGLFGQSFPWASVFAQDLRYKAEQCGAQVVLVEEEAAGDNG